MTNKCRVTSCEKPWRVKKHRLCMTHYYRWIEHGRTYLVRQPNGSGYCTPRGYIEIYEGGRKTALHRLIMERHLGRRLSRFENVHHKDGDVSNNTLSNLEVMSHGEHTRLHHTKTKNGRKNCARCRRTKSLKLFFRQGLNSDRTPRHAPYCKHCFRILMRTKWKH